MTTTTLHPIHRILDKLKYTGQREAGRQYKCTCPGHDDGTESLSVTEAKGGKVLVHCFAGCKPEAIIAKLGLTMADLMPPTVAKQASKRVVATYDYRDEKGALLYQAVRYEPKAFSQRRPDGKGNWIWNMKGVQRVPYRLTSLLAWPSSEWVFIPEGEKDCDALDKLGLVATCNVGGAGKWGSELNKWLEGKRVCILPDNDAPGREHAHKVAAQLMGKVTQVRIVEPPGLPAKGDISDWIAAGGTAEQLLELVEAAPDYIAPLPTPSAPYTNGAAKEHGNGNRTVITSATIMADLTSLGYSFELNELDDVIEVGGQRLDDGLAARIRTQMRDLGHKNMGAIEDAYTAEAYENQYHPVRRYLDSLVWDGQDHFGRLCSHVKDKHEPIVYRDKTGEVISVVSVFRVWLYRWMLAAVAKAYEKRVQGPILVLDGNQGIGKSRLASYLGSALPDMFLESPVHADDKDHDRYLATRWIWEIAELGATTRRADREALKAFITKGDVTFRKPYGKHPITKPALANFIGTINNEAGFLTDPTGNRRFLVVTLDSIDWQYENVVDVHQLWAQMVADYKSGERWELLPPEQAARDGMNKGDEREDPIEDMIVRNFDIDLFQKDWFMFTGEIASQLRTLGAKGDDQVLYNGIGTALRRLKLPAVQKMIGGQRGRGYSGIRKKPELHTLHTPAHPKGE
jgi:predicted P-loop ATPase